MHVFSAPEFFHLTAALARGRMEAALKRARSGFETLTRRGGDWQAIEEMWIKPWCDIRLLWNQIDFYATLGGRREFFCGVIEREIQALRNEVQSSPQIWLLLHDSKPGAPEARYVHKELLRSHFCAGAGLKASAKRDLEPVLQQIYSLVERYEVLLLKQRPEAELAPVLQDLLVSRRRLAAVFDLPSFHAFVACRSLALKPAEIGPILKEYTSGAAPADPPKLPGHRFNRERAISAALRICEKVYAVEIEEVGEPVPEGMRLFQVRGDSGDGYLYLQILAEKTQPMTVGLAAKSELGPPAALIRIGFQGGLSFANWRSLLHECGHAVQHVLTDLSSPMVSSIESVPMDFVELSSSVLEDFLLYDWAYETLTCDGGIMKECQSYHSAFQAFRLHKQAHLGNLDLLMHGEDPVLVAELKEREPRIFSFHHGIVTRYAGAYFAYALARGLSRDLHSHMGDIPSFGSAFKNAAFHLSGRENPLQALKPLLKRKSACGF